MSTSKPEASTPTASPTVSSAPGHAADPVPWPHTRRTGSHGSRPWLPHALLLMVLVIATAGLVYELVIAAVASYVLGDSVRQFSLIIGVYLSALGLGAYLSRSIDTRLELIFVDVELGAALIGGLSAPLLFLAFGFSASFQVVLYTIVVLVGVLVGLELPLLIRILEREFEFKDLIAKALTFDYAGALLGSLSFSLFLVPKLGLIRASLLCGLLNAGAGFIATYLLAGAPHVPERKMRHARWRAGLIFSGLLVAFIAADEINRYAESLTFDGTVVSAESSEYQRTVLVRRGGDHELYLNGHLQFSSRDEHRYHEALVHPAMASVLRPQRVLIGGGGDGLAVREVLKWSTVQQVHLVDLDPMVTRLAQEEPVLRELNGAALADPRVTVFNEDAMLAFAEFEPSYDIIILDFPDPSTYSLGKLYSVHFYRQVLRLLATGGALAVQSTSPELATKSFWCVVATLESAGFETYPYHAFLPSFGDWGYVLGTKRRTPAFTRLPGGLKYLDDHRLEALFKMPKDMRRPEVDINRLGTQALVSYYLDEWGALN